MYAIFKYKNIQCMLMNQRKCIVLTLKQYQKLSSLGNHNETFGELIVRLCDSYKKSRGSKK